MTVKKKRLQLYNSEITSRGSLFAPAVVKAKCSDFHANWISGSVDMTYLSEVMLILVWFVSILTFTEMHINSKHKAYELIKLQVNGS